MRRKQFLIGAGFGLVGSALAACTTYGKKEEPAAQPSAPPAGAGAPAADTIATTAEVPVGSGVIVDDIVLTQPTAGEFKGFSAVCTHAGCKLSEVAEGTISCRCHGSRFNLDGSVANGPATRPLKAETVAVRGDSVVRG